MTDFLAQVGLDVGLSQKLFFVFTISLLKFAPKFELLRGEVIHYILHMFLESSNQGLETKMLEI